MVRLDTCTFRVALSSKDAEIITEEDSVSVWSPTLHVNNELDSTETYIRAPSGPQCRQERRPTV